jgi:hypothetical protein
MGVFEDFIKYMEELKDEDWNILVDSNWTVKDVIAHLVGWEEECVRILKEPLVGEQPWYYLEEDKNYLEFNRQNIEKYKDYTSKELLEKWKFFRQLLEEEIKKIGGESAIKKIPELFKHTHYLEHLEQIKKIVNNHNNS